MRKIVVIILISLISVLFFSMFIMVKIDNSNIDIIKKEILKNTDIKDIEYLNKYDNSYIVVDNEYIYLFNSNYEEITKLDNKIVADNKNNYDIIYKDKTIMYMDNYKNKDGLIFKYYDINTYELIDTIVVGGN